jgi:hypothetical protein
MRGFSACPIPLRAGRCPILSFEGR